MGAGDATGELSERLRALPSVERLAGQLDGTSRSLAVTAARRVIAARRAQLLAGVRDETDLVAAARTALEEARRTSLGRVINATGVVLHTNLGRAPLADTATRAAAAVATGYSNLEFDLGTGARGSRQAHVRDLLCELTGAEAALVVNNCAAAVLLGAAALAGPGRTIVVARGQLIEIGGSFRIPEVISVSGSRLVEVGTTNRTRRGDFEAALAAPGNQPVGAILRAHPSNFRTLGFTEEVAIEELCRLGPPVIDDVGSGRLDEQLPVLDAEPSVRRSVAAGASLVCFSGDKLLGGPQAGVIVGRAGAVARAARHPLARALRIDKLSLAALQATLALYREPAQARRRVPALAMLDAAPEDLARRADGLCRALAAGAATAAVVTAVARVGGGALPLLDLEGPAVAVDPGPPGADALARALRAGQPAVVPRIAHGRVLLDPRTMTDEDARAAARAVLEALRRPDGPDR